MVPIFFLICLLEWERDLKSKSWLNFHWINVSFHNLPLYKVGAKGGGGAQPLLTSLEENYAKMIAFFSSFCNYNVKSFGVYNMPLERCF